VISAKSSFFSLAFAALVLLGAPSVASAQTHWDANVHAGASGRVFSNGALPGSFGPVVGFDADVAVIPLLRVGLYGDYEYTDTTEPKLSSVISFGARVKIMLPGYRSNIHWWLFTGIGAVIWEAPGFNFYDTSTGAGVTTGVPAASGYFAEIPLGIGMGWRVHRPWEIIAELQGRVGFDWSGSYFTQCGYTNPDDGGCDLGTTRPTSTAAGSSAAGLGTGNDVVAFLFTLGIGLDQ
jgi:hypothetical protein